jgi:hypothetical protein
MSWRSIQRAVSGLFLLFVLLDLAVPGFCQTDDLPHGADHEMTVQESGPRSPLESDRAVPDDCFCCCIHIQAEPHFYFPVKLTAVDVVSPAEIDRTPSDPQVLFHPPRSV